MTIKILNIIIYNPSVGHEVLMRDSINKYVSASLITQFTTSFFVAFRQNPSGNEIEMEGNIIYVNGDESFVPGIITKTLKSVQYCIDTLGIEFDYLYRTNISTVTDLVKLSQIISAVINKSESADESADGDSVSEINYAGFVNFNLYYDANDLSKVLLFAQGTNIILNKSTSQKLLGEINYVVNNYSADDVLIGLVLKNVGIFPMDFGRHFMANNLREDDDFTKYVCYRNKTVENRNEDALRVNDIVCKLLLQITNYESHKHDHAE